MPINIGNARVQVLDDPCISMAAQGLLLAQLWWQLPHVCLLLVQLQHCSNDAQNRSFSSASKQCIIIVSL